MKILLFGLFTVACFAQTFAKMPVVTNCYVAGDKAADDTAIIQACINAAPDDSQVIFPANATMKITATINIHNRYGLALIGQTGRFGGPSASTPAPGFYWFGPDGGTMFSYDRTDNVVTQGLLFFNAPGFIGGTGGASVLIDVDQTVPPPGTTTANIFERNAFVSGTQNPNFIGIRFAQVSTNNVEAMTVKENFFSCAYGVKAGEGIVIGPGGHFNAKKHLYSNNTISSCAIGVDLSGGSADILNNKFNLTTTDIKSYAVDPIKIDGNDSENSSQFFLGAVAAPITMTDNRIAATNPPSGQASVWIVHGGGSTLTFEGNSFDGGNFMPVGFDSKNNTGGSLVSSGNAYPYGGQTIQGFLTVPYTLTSMNDGVLPNFPFLMSSGACCAGDIGGMGFDAYSQRWMLSTNIITDPVGHTLLSDPTAGLTFSGVSGLGTCTSGNDLTSNSTGRSLSSLSSTFTFNEPGGYITISGGVGFVPGTYYVSSGSSGSVHNLGTTQTTGSNGFGASFVINRGRTVIVRGAPGIADTMWVCAQTASGYAWKQIF